MNIPKKWSKQDAVWMAEQQAKTSLQAVGNKLGLTRERVRQIIEAYEIDPLMVVWLKQYKKKPLSYMDRFRKKFWRMTRRDTQTGCINWVGSRHVNGYGRVGINGKSDWAHRVSWRITKGEIPADNNRFGTMCVCHKCDNPACVNPDHLFLGTISDNIKDRDLKGRGRSGPGPRRFDRQKIRKLREQGLPVKRVAERLGCSPALVYAVAPVGLDN